LSFGGYYYQRTHIRKEYISGHYSSNNTEKFNGDVWSNTGNLITGRFELAGCGTQS